MRAGEARLTIFYHADCVDGYTAAWAVQECAECEVLAIPYSYGEPLPEVSGNVLFLDITPNSPPPGCVILDHHVTNKPSWAVPEEYVTNEGYTYLYSERNSGAGLAMRLIEEWGRGENPFPGPPPKISPYLVKATLLCVLAEDYDTYRHKVPDSKYFQAYAEAGLPAPNLNNAYASILDTGKAILRVKESIAEATSPVSETDTTVLYVAARELRNYIADKHKSKTVIIWYDNQISFRNQDALALARRFFPECGGHQSACGVSGVSFQELYDAIRGS